MITVSLAWLLLRLRPMQLAGVISAALGVFIMVARADWQAVVNLEFNRGDLQVILAILFLDEELFLYHLPGAALVCAGIFLVVRN